MAPSGAERSVEVLISTSRFTTWIPGTRPGMTRMATGKRPIFILAAMLVRGMTRAGSGRLRPLQQLQQLPVDELVAAADRAG